MNGRIYPGYPLTPVGSVRGLLWGLAGGAGAGAIFAAVYRGLAGKIGD